MITRRDFFHFTAGGGTLLALSQLGCERSTSGTPVSVGEGRLDPGSWLPYGSTDPAVLIQNPLTSPMSVTNMPFSNVLAVGLSSVIIHDDVKGMQPNGGAYRCQTFNGKGGITALDSGFQISLEVERSWLCLDDATVGSMGTTLGDECCLAFKPAVSDSFQYWIFERIGPSFFGGRAFGCANLNKNSWTGATEIVAPQSVGKEDFVTLNLGVVRERDEVTVLLAVDGLVLAKCVGADVTLSGLVNELFVGSSTLTRYMSGYFIRNLQIAGRPPIFEAHPLLRKIVLWGDSLAGSLSYGDGIMYDNMTGLSFLRKLAKLGIYPGAMVTQSYGGYAFGNYTGMSAIPLSTTLSALEDQNPSVVLIRGGTNDMVNGRYNNTEMRNSIASIVDTILGWNSTVRVVIASIPTGYFQTNLATYTAAHAANRAQISAYFNEMTLTRPRLHYVDTYTAFGGENPLPNTFVGQQNGLLNNLHFAARGGLIQGEDFAEGVLTILNEIGRAPELSQQSWPVQDSRLV